MKRFKINQRITIVDPMAECLGRGDGTMLKGRTGIVRRLRRCDDGAWVSIDGDPLPAVLRSFPADDEAGRGQHIILFPEECEQVKP